MNPEKDKEEPWFVTRIWRSMFGRKSSVRRTSNPSESHSRKGSHGQRGHSPPPHPPLQVATPVQLSSEFKDMVDVDSLDATYYDVNREVIMSPDVASVGEGHPMEPERVATMVQHKSEYMPLSRTLTLEPRIRWNMVEYQIKREDTSTEGTSRELESKVDSQSKKDNRVKRSPPNISGGKAQDAQKKVDFHLRKDEGHCQGLEKFGSVVFKEQPVKDSEFQESKYMLVVEDTNEQINKIAANMAQVWKMNAPKLIISLISSASYFKPWKRQQEIEDFQDGLMKYLQPSQRVLAVEGAKECVSFISQAANMTEMWILQDGRNVQLASMVGQALVKEKSRRNILQTEQALVRFPTLEPLPKLTVIGVVRQSDLTMTLPTARPQEKSAPQYTASSNFMNFIMNSYQPYETESHNIVVEDIQSKLGEPLSDQAIPYMTHMIVTGPELSQSAVSSFILRLESSLMKSVEEKRRQMSLSAIEFDKRDKAEMMSAPLIGLLVDGGPEDIDHVLSLLRKNVPVIVISSPGKASGLLAFAYRAALQNYGTDSYETYVKTELLNRLTEFFPHEFRNDILGRNQYRDKILQCVAYATQGDYGLLTIIERNTTYEMKDLSKVILNSVLMSGENISKDELRLNLQLIIDWMEPALAVTEIFDKYSADKFWIEEDQFEQVLLRPGREKFVEIFLDRGFLLYKYLTPRRLEMLFERCSDKDYFVSIFLETVLGEKMTSERIIPEDFVNDSDSNLNHILAIMTGLKYLIDPLQLSLNTSADRVEDVVTAEQRALHALIFWAALTNNQKLVHIFWSRTNEPMAMALVLSTMYKRLSSHWVTDHDIKLKIKAMRWEFGRLAVQMLDLCYNESRNQALNSLRTQLPMFNNYTVLDLAMLGKNKYFIAHPCCQNLIFNMWYGNVRVSQRHAFLSDNVKIILCVLLVFPTLLWIETVSSGPKKYASRTRHYFKKSVLAEKGSMKRQSLGKSQLFKKLLQLWKAPLLKFWMSQIFFVVFLLHFMYTMSEPFCGSSENNYILAVWLLAYICDHLYIIVAIKLHCSEMNIKANLRAIAVFIYTFLVIVVFRIVLPGYLSFTTVKIMLSFSLIYFCYLAMGYFFPVSPVYGPMLVNITVMMKRDLVTWLKMWSLTLISGSVAIHAALLPALPLTLESLWKALRRGIFGLFLTQVYDIRESGQCTCLYNYTASLGCMTSTISGMVHEKLTSCVNNSFGSYVILLQYIFITKLVYLTLIFALTAVTLNTTYERSIEIWKYQFFLLVVNNQRRPLLPVPFVLLYYPFVIISCCAKGVVYVCRAWCPCCKRVRDKSKPVSEYSIWRGLIRLHKKNERVRQEMLNQATVAEDRLKVIAKDQMAQGKQMDNLNDRLYGIINSQTSLSLTLEHMKHVMEELANKNYITAGDVLPLRNQHTRCRMSPYPGTSIQRFPVFDKNVAWEENYPTYDPQAFSRMEEDYEEERRPFIDPDMFELMKQREDRERLSVEEGVHTEELQFSPEFNAELEMTTSFGEKYVVDRTSWITKDDQPVQYTLDTSGVPRNPMGRTGLRGRGNLWRWGPNHMIYAIVSRWMTVSSTIENMQTPKVVNGKKKMEILAVHNELLNEDSLPGDFITGKNSKFNVICEVFMRDLLCEKDVPSSTQLDQDDMVQFFKQFVVSDLLSGILGRSLTATSTLTSRLVYKGYMDDSNNTDNAWVEAEVWNFHYHSKDRLDNKILNKKKHWREVSSVLQLASSQLTHVLEAARMFEDVLI